LNFQILEDGQSDRLDPPLKSISTPHFVKKNRGKSLAKNLISDFDFLSEFGMVIHLCENTLRLPPTSPDTID